jgi:hypothetical protein
VADPINRFRPSSCYTIIKGFSCRVGYEEGGCWVTNRGIEMCRCCKR